jgi:hypothetical protein
MSTSKPTKNDVLNKSEVNLKKSIHQSPITIHPMFLARYSHKNEAVFCWDRAVFMGLGYGSPNVMG